MCTGTHDFIPAVNVAKVAMYWDTPGGKALNIFHFRKATPFDKDDLAALEAVISLNWDAQFSPLQATAVECNRILLTDINEDDSFQVDRAPSTPLAGGLNENAMPSNVTVATKFGTGHAGRSYRGRSYFIGLTEPQCIGDILVAGVSDDITSAWVDFIGAVHDSDLGADLVIVSYCNDGAWRDEALVNPVSEITTENTLDSMRTRLLGRGM